MVMDKRRAFTLVELLVVIAIIALLMSILMPALARVRKQAKDVLCQGNLKQWGVCFTMYTDDYDGYFHEGWFGAGPARHWMSVLRSCYSNESNLRYCPMATKPRTEGGHGVYSAWGIFPGGWSGWGEDDFGSYGINSWVCNTPPGEEHYGPPKKYWRTTAVRKATNTPLFLDAWWFDGWPEPFNGPLLLEDEYISSDSMEAMGDFCVNRHGGGLNCLFLDMSVRKIGIKELWKLKWHRMFNINGPYTIAGGVTRAVWEQEAPWMVKYPDY
jgi:prepilin-type N-terminal cleavage/methylation domain-containing protein/prepilin-type processing-associated H-X9-DG protein